METSVTAATTADGTERGGIMQITPSCDDLIIENLDGSTPGTDDPSGWCFILIPGAAPRAA
ncbi:hypothetical protein [Streptomyces sp. NPDC058475]|uniref:hypothetical protein n=1 Tax=unclassified Streptomyces TaxID=2593676 RepID=UPI0036464F78